MIDGVRGDGIDGRPSAPGVGPAATSVSRRRGVPRTSKLVATAGRTEDASGAGRVGARPRRLLLVAPASPFELLGSSSASGSASWSESTAAAEAETALALFPVTGFVDFDLGLDLPSAVCGSAVGSGSFFGDVSMRYSGWCSDSIQRSTPRCTPRSPSKVSLGRFEPSAKKHTNGKYVGAPQRHDGEHLNCDVLAPPPYG